MLSSSAFDQLFSDIPDEVEEENNNSKRYSSSCIGLSSKDVDVFFGDIENDDFEMQKCNLEEQCKTPSSFHNITPDASIPDEPSASSIRSFANKCKAENAPKKQGKKRKSFDESRD